MSTLESAEQWDAHERELAEMIRRNERHDEIHRGFVRGLVGAIVIASGTAAYLGFSTWSDLSSTSPTNAAKPLAGRPEVVANTAVTALQAELALGRGLRND